MQNTFTNLMDTSVWATAAPEIDGKIAVYPPYRALGGVTELDRTPEVSVDQHVNEGSR